MPRARRRVAQGGVEPVAVAAQPRTPTPQGARACTVEEVVVVVQTQERVQRVARPRSAVQAAQAKIWELEQHRLARSLVAVAVERKAQPRERVALGRQSFPPTDEMGTITSH